MLNLFKKHKNTFPFTINSRNWEGWRQGWSQVISNHDIDPVMLEYTVIEINKQQKNILQSTKKS